MFRTVDMERIAVDKEYTWSILTTLCTIGNVQDILDLFSILHRVKHVPINAVFDFVTEEVDGETLLHISARNGHTGLLAYFIRSGVEANADNSYGWTALHEACKFHRTEVCYI